MPKILGYESPLSTRHGSSQMRKVWGEFNKRKLWRKAWLELLSRQIQAGLIPSAPAGWLAELESLSTDYRQTDLDAALAVEAVVHHDVVAEMECFAEMLPSWARGYIHMGATSSDIEDYAEMDMIRESCDLLSKSARALARTMAVFIMAHLDVEVIGSTHLQMAEPTTIGYRFAQYGNDLAISLNLMLECASEFDMSKGFKGAVGTEANAVMLAEMFKSSYIVGSSYWLCGQTYPRTADFRLLSTLAGMAAGLSKMALDVRVMQSDGLVYEGKADSEVGSSAMPAKSNPIISERICGLARVLASHVQTCWHSCSSSILERTLDEKTSRRYYLPETMLLMSEILLSAQRLMDSLQVDVDKCRKSVSENWRAWLPSRVLAYSQAKGWSNNRAKLHNTVEDEIPDTRLKFIDPDKWLKEEIGSDAPTMKEMYYLDRARVLALDVSNMLADLSKGGTTCNTSTSR